MKTDNVFKSSVQVLQILKETDKSVVALALIDSVEGPVIVKKYKLANADVYHSLQQFVNSHIPQIYEINEYDENLEVVEEYVDGETLETLMSAGNLSDLAIYDYMLQLCNVLRHLHTLTPPIIHRDIKASNIIITSEGTLKLIDFDSSRIYKEDSESDTVLLGTKGHAAPEQFGFSQTDIRSDIYSFGVLLSQLVKFISDKNTAKGLHKIAARCTRFDPDERYFDIASVRKKMVKIFRRSNKLCKLSFAAVSFAAILAICFTVWKLASPPVGHDAPPLTSEVIVPDDITPIDSAAADDIPEDNVSSVDTTEDIAQENAGPSGDTAEDIAQENAGPTGDTIEDTAQEDIASEDSDAVNSAGKSITELIEIKSSSHTDYYPHDTKTRDLVFCTEFLCSKFPTEITDISFSPNSGDAPYYLTDYNHYRFENSVLYIGRDYLATLPAGKYQVRIGFANETTNGHGAFPLYVYEGESAPEDQSFFFFSNFMYIENDLEQLTFPLPHNFEDKIIGLKNADIDVDPSFYKIYDSGRRLVMNAELFSDCLTAGPMDFNILLENNKYLKFKIAKDME